MPHRSTEQDDDKGRRGPRKVRSHDELEKLADLRTEEIQQYLKERYDRREVVARTATASGQQIDWVPLESQASGERIADPPEEDGVPDYEQDDRRAELLVFELQREGVERGPEGTVPLVRKPIEKIRPGVLLQDWLAKGTRARQEPPPDASSEYEVPGASEHKYGYTSQNVTCYGTEGAINAWDPYVEWSNEFSLGQLWLTRGSGDGKQTLEVGHQEYRDLYGDWVPHLFVFYTTNGYTSSGDNQGGYNQDVDGWVQYSNQIHPEAVSSPVSTLNGAQFEMQLKVQLWQGNWWVRVNGVWIGYYPASLYNSGGLRSEASKVAWGGEIVDSDHTGTTATDMGNGHWPEEGWQRAAYMNRLRYQSTTGGSMSRYSATAWESHPLCYGVEGHFDDGGSWGSHFWWGGSGRNSGCP
jgi:hypothetical protein